MFREMRERLTKHLRKRGFEKPSKNKRVSATIAVFVHGAPREAARVPAAGELLGHEVRERRNLAGRMRPADALAGLRRARRPEAPACIFFR